MLAQDWIYLESQCKFEQVLHKCHQAGTWVKAWLLERQFENFATFCDAYVSSNSFKYISYG